MVSNQPERNFKKNKPVILQKGIHVNLNPETKKIEGLPEEWITTLKLPH